MSDSFDRRYELGVQDEESEPRVRPRPRGPAAAPFALKGCVLTPSRKIENGYVVVAGETIDTVGAAAPDGVRVIETDGVIAPGLIDLHGHPEYNVFAAWEPPQQFPNRYRWRASPIYKEVVRKPWKRLTRNPGSLIRDLTRYAEARALVGGVTAIQGASAMYPSKEEALVRNVDLRVFGQHKARSSIDPLKEPKEKRDKLKAAIAAGDVDAYYIHLAEGVDPTSRNEFARLVDRGLLTSATVIIHGTAFDDAILGDVKDAGAKMVWSPQSNLRLYGKTTPAARALALGIPLGLGADWLPSGSQTLLDELKVARRALIEQDVDLTDSELHKRLVEMVTTDAAAIAGLDAFIGTLAPDRPADLVVFERRHDDPWRNVVEADPAWVQLVTVGGDLAYGRTDWITALASPDGYGAEIAWGRPMLIDTRYRARAAGTPPPPALSEIRRSLLNRYPQTGPIFA